MKNYYEKASKQRYIYFFIGLVVIAAVTLPRLIHLDADPQPGFIPLDVGYQIDEGYKTFAPKNLLVFGKQIWNPEDQYSGWMQSSPVTQWAYYLAFNRMELNLKSARTVSVIYFALFLTITLILLVRRYGIVLALTGVLLLATDAALFYFSRSALFETAMILFVYTGILLTTLIPNNKPLNAAAIMVAVALIAMFTVKLTAVLYFTPPLIACALVISLDAGRRKYIYFSALALPIVIMAFITRNEWLWHISWDTLGDVPERFLLNPMPELTPFALLLAYSCILHLLLVKPVLLNNIYRLSLAAMIIGTPLILSFFPNYNPPRYYVALVPACLLIFVEWLHLKPWRESEFTSFSIAKIIAITVVFIPFTMLLLRAINILVLINLPFSMGEDPGIDITTQYKLLPLFLLGLLIVYYAARDSAIKSLGLAIPLLGFVNLSAGIAAQADTLLHPSYDSQIIRKQLSALITDAESVAGDWAPFFTAEAPIRSFYMSKGINFPTEEHISKIRPDYFLDSGTPFDRKSLRSLQANRNIRLSDPILLGTYMEHEVSIYQIEYLVDKQTSVLLHN
ncbi:MAG: hypothetical protein WCH04_22685 [Gammaproteobacteria bacterium]